jgi:hypothetical protein
MANITVTSDYNLADIGMVDSLAAPNLHEFINKFEDIILKKILGYALYKLYKTVDPPTSGIYYDIFHGKDYTDLSGMIQEWKGLKYLLVAFITFYFKRENEVKASQSGDIEMKFDNAIKTTGAISQSRSWNEGCANAIVLDEFIRVNIASYPLYDNSKNEYIQTVNHFGF